MEDQPLNKVSSSFAHQQHRRADAHLKYKRFSDAMHCHQNAAELLLDAMKSTSSSRALESITLQHSYHLKQKDLIKAKKEQHDRVKKAMENLKNVSQDPTVNIPGHPDSTVQIAIYRAIHDADSLLAVLLKPSQDSETVQQLAYDESTEVAEDALEEQSAPKSSSSKKDKDQQVIIEELQTLSQSLHTLVDKLVMQFEVVKDENITLKERVEYLESERKKYLNMHSDVVNASHQANFGLNFASGTNSQFMFSPTEFISESMKDSEHNTQIERPNFDLTAFQNDLTNN